MEELEQLELLNEIVPLIGDKFEGFPDTRKTVEEIEAKKKEIIDYASRLVGDAYPEYVEAVAQHLQRRMCKALEG